MGLIPAAIRSAMTPVFRATQTVLDFVGNPIIVMGKFYDADFMDLGAESYVRLIGDDGAQWPPYPDEAEPANDAARDLETMVCR